MAVSSQLPRSTPEEQGISSAGILKFIEAVEEQAHNNKCQELHSIMIVRHGYVVSEGWWYPYGPELPHVMFSLSKSFTSTAIGLAVSEGLLLVDNFVISFFPEDLPENISENMKAMRVRHLLTMSTGNAEDTFEALFRSDKVHLVKEFFSIPLDYFPGTHFVYNSGATYMLSAIIQKITGQNLIDYLTPRLFGPLGIENPTWDSCPMGINIGGFGLKIKTEDIAKFGQLYLQNGYWNGKQILPQFWIDEATASHIPNHGDWSIDCKQGYGYQFWRCRHGAYRADGGLAQLCIIMPDKDAVIAITSAARDVQAVMNNVWEYLLPAMKDTELNINHDDQITLQSKLSNLYLKKPEGKPYEPISEEISGKLYQLEHNSLNLQDISFVFNENIYKLEQNCLDLQDISFIFNQDECIIVQNENRTKSEIKCGMGKWVESEACIFGVQTRTSAYGMWADQSTFVINIRFIETPLYYTIIHTFDSGKLTFEIIPNVVILGNLAHVITGCMLE